MNNKNLFHHFAERCQQHSTQIAIHYKDRSRWHQYRWQDLQKIVSGLAKSFQDLGIEKGDRVAIMMNTRPEWLITDLAVMAAGGVVVPIYPNVLPEDVSHISKDSSAKLIVLEDSQQWARWKAAKVDLENPPDAIVLDSESVEPTEDWKSWSGLLDTGRESVENSEKHLQDCANSLQLSDIATIPYTSGTTGKPKGVVLSHRQVMSELNDVFRVIPVNMEDLSLTFLPFSHILGRVEAWGSVYAGYQLGFAESIDRIKQNLGELKPSFLIAVPRIFEKLHAAIITQAETQPLKKHVFQAALKVGQKYSSYLAKGEAPPFTLVAENRIADSLVFSTIREKLGGRLRFAVSGGAPLNAEVSEFFHAIGILVLEGYGLTETTAGVSFNTPIRYRFGTVGPALDDVEFKIAEDGEVLVKSDKVMVGYFNNEEATREVFEGDYFKTGDIGEIDADGFLKITDRKKDLIKTAGGKYVAPQKLEGLLKLDPLISNVLIHGDQRKYIVSLVTVDPVELKNFASKKGLEDLSHKELVAHDETRKKVKEILAGVNSQLARYEAIKKFHILEKEFSIESGELTPSLKVKRKFCDQKFKAEIDSLYSG